MDRVRRRTRAHLFKREPPLDDGDGVLRPLNEEGAGVVHPRQQGRREPRRAARAEPAPRGARVPRCCPRVLACAARRVAAARGARWRILSPRACPRRACPAVVARLPRTSTRHRRHRLGVTQELARGGGAAARTARNRPPGRREGVAALDASWAALDGFRCPGRKKQSTCVLASATIARCLRISIRQCTGRTEL